MSNALQTYMQTLQAELARGHDNGYTCQQALRTLLETLLGVPLDYDGRRREVGGPDLMLWRGGMPAGQVFIADMGADLQTLHDERITGVLENALLTNYLDFQLGSRRARLGTFSAGRIQPERSSDEALRLLQTFAAFQPVSSSQPQQLAAHLGAQSRALHTVLQRCIENPTGDLLPRLYALGEIGTTPAEAADILTRVTASGLFAARARHKGAARQQTFNRRDLYWNLPPTSAFLRAFFHQTDNAVYDSRATWAVDVLAGVLARANMDSILHELGQESDDAIGRFYETFTRSYGLTTHATPALAVTVARFITQSIHAVLGKQFKYDLGLADNHIELIIPRAGQGTSLYIAIQRMFQTLRQKRQLGAWETFVQDHILPNIRAYETNLADYAITHLKAGIQLQRRGYAFSSNQRLRVYRAALDAAPSADPPPDPLARLFWQEAHDSQPQPGSRLPIIISHLFAVDHLRFAVALMRRHEQAVLALVAPPQFLDDPDDAALRGELLAQCSAVYVLDVAGHYSILLGIRSGKEAVSRIQFAQAESEDDLRDPDIFDFDWQVMTPLTPSYPLVPQIISTDLQAEYRAGWKLDEIFRVHLPGVEPARVAYTLEGAQSMAQRLDTAHILPLLYRPFDQRYTVEPLADPLLKGVNYFLCASRQITQDESEGGEVLCADRLVHREAITGGAFMFPLYLYNPPGSGDAPFSPGQNGRQPNLSHKFILTLAQHLHMTFVPLERGDLKYTFGTEDVLHYVYAVLNSGQYRIRYADFLLEDFARVPLTASKKRFRALVKRGRQLINLHTLRGASAWPLRTGFHGSGSSTITADYPRFIELAGESGGRIYINDQQYFEGVERRVWRLHIGGYPVLQEWLEQRSGRVLDWQAIYTFQQIVVALTRQVRRVNTIDEVIPAWPLG